MPLSKETKQNLLNSSKRIVIVSHSRRAERLGKYGYFFFVTREELKIERYFSSKCQ